MPTTMMRHNSTLTAMLCTCLVAASAASVFSQEITLQATLEVQSPPDVVWPWFGSAAAVDGQILAVASTPAQGTGIKYQPGEVWIWNLSTPETSTPTKISPPKHPSNYIHPQFGKALALAETPNLDVLAVCADTTRVENNASYLEGAVHIYEKLGAEWNHVATFSPPPGLTLNFAQSVAVHPNGNLIAVGDTGGGSGPPRGAVYIYERDLAGSWQYSTRIEPPTNIPAPPSGFGRSVSLSGNELLIGWATTHGSNLHVGAAVLYTLVDNQWVQTQSFAGNNQGDRFGTSVALDHELIAIGAPGDWSWTVDGNCNFPITLTTPGRVHTYSRQGSSWIQHASTLESHSLGGFGRRVSLHHQQLVVGGEHRPSAQVYRGTGDPVSAFELIEVLADTTSCGDSKSSGLASDGQVIVVGDRWPGTGLGVAYVYTYSSSTFESICDGSTGICPCGNSAQFAFQGCQHDRGVGARLHAQIMSSGDLRFTTFTGAIGRSGVLFSGLLPSSGVPFNYGKLCIAGPLGSRYGLKVSQAYNGEVSWQLPSPLEGLGSIHFQVWYPQPAAPHCGRMDDGINFSNAIAIRP